MLPLHKGIVQTAVLFYLSAFRLLFFLRDSSLDSLIWQLRPLRTPSVKS